MADDPTVVEEGEVRLRKSCALVDLNMRWLTSSPSRLLRHTDVILGVDIRYQWFPFTPHDTTKVEVHAAALKESE